MSNQTRYAIYAAIAVGSLVAIGVGMWKMWGDFHAWRLDVGRDRAAWEREPPDANS
ncbi:MAG TPA: hypothetical protein VFE62_06315 [Gemmataceae bacterium]|nr:hypothetical protein [Gemmataceae bacterium]